MTNLSKSILLLLIITAVTFLAYFPCLKAGFANFDDSVHLMKNTDVQRLDMEHIKRIFQSRVSRTYIPLSLLTYAVEYHFFKLNPFIYHLNNVLLHLIVTGLIFYLARRFDLSLMASVWAALIFGIHPMHVESVAWITERKDVLCAVLYLSALLTYWKYLESGRNKWGWYGITVTLGFLSMLAKPMAYSLPVVLLILDWWNHRKPNLSMVLDKVPIAIYILLLSFMTLSANKMMMAYKIHEMLLIWIWSFSFFIQKFFIPNYYILIYEFPSPISIFNPAYVEAIAVFTLIICLLIRFWKFRLFMFAILLYLATISMLIIRNVWEFGNYTVIADRFIYIPSIGFCMLLGYGINRIQEIFSKSKNDKRFLNVLIVFFFLFLFYRTYQQCLIWRDNISLWSNTIKYKPALTLAYVNRAHIYIDRGQLDLALRDLNIAEVIDKEGPKDERLYVARGIVYYVQNKFDLAFDNFNHALEINPRHLDGLYDRAIIWRTRGQYDKAIADFNSAIAIKSEPRSYVGLGTVYQLKGDLEQARHFYEEALRLDPDNQEARRYYEPLSKKPH